MDQDEKRWRLAIALAGSNIKTFASTPDAVGLLWRAVDAICTAEPKPAEALSESPASDHAELLDDLTHAADRVQELELEARVAELIRAEEEARKAQREVAGWQARAEAAEAQLTEARELIAIMEAREVKRDDQDADARMVAEWVSRYAAGRDAAPYVAAARRYLAGEPSPKATPCEQCGSKESVRGFDSRYLAGEPSPKAEPDKTASAEDALKYIVSLCESKAGYMFYNDAWRGAWDEARVCALAALERHRRGEPFGSASQLMSMSSGEASTNIPGTTQHWRTEDVKAAPKPPSAAMEQLREAMHRYDSTNDGDKRADVLSAARAVLAEADGGQ